MKKGISLTQKNKLARESDQKIDKLQEVASIAFLYLGQELKRQKEEKLYKYLGESPEYETWEEYIKSKHIELRKAYYLVQIYTIFCERLKFKPEELADTHWTSLRAILPAVREENAEEMVEKAKVLSRGDLELEVKQMQMGLEVRKCQHTWKRITFWKCTKCGERSIVEPGDGEIIGGSNY